MSKSDRPMLLVGSIPGLDSEAIMRLVAPVVGDMAIGLTDGEPGARRLWVMYVGHGLWANHPDIEVARQSVGVDPDHIPEAVLPREFAHMVPAGYDDLPWYMPKQDVTSIATEGQSTGYPEHAERSWELFKSLRDEGVIPEGLRFQVDIPFPDDAVRLFTNSPDAMDMMVDAYIEIVQRDVAAICETIPHEDLLIQWDINWETIGFEHGDHLPDAAPMQFSPNIPVRERFDRYVRELNGAVPDDVPLGMHLCYGELQHKHFREPADLRASVEMANRATEVLSRRIDYYHMAVPRNRNDDQYFEPLGDLAIGDATVYAGLVHYTDGVEGSIDRLNTLKRHYTGALGVSTECGLSNRPPHQDLVQLLEIHRGVAAAI